jgi:pimeloyl-ACP methyl ester carboxylesterase
MINNFDTSIKSKDWDHYFTVLSTIKLHYVRKGTGDPVILLHGWPGFWYDWRYVLPKLSLNFDVIAPDFRGFGESDKPQLLPHEGYAPEHLANDIMNLLKELDLGKVIIVAHDIGATIAQTIARQHVEMVKGMVLLNPPYPGIGNRRFDPSIQKEFWYQHFHNLPLA